MDTVQILLPPGLDARQHQFPLMEVIHGVEVGRFWNVSSLFAPLFGFKREGDWGGGAVPCSKVVPLLPELLLTFMNRAFTPSSPHGVPPLCTVQISQLTCSGPGRERETMVPSCSCRNNSSQLFGISIPLCRSFSKKFEGCCRYWTLCSFSPPATAAAICGMM